MKKNLPLILVIVGVVFIAGAAFIALQSSPSQSTSAAPVSGSALGNTSSSTGVPTMSSATGTPVPSQDGLPVTIAGLPLTNTVTGDAAMATIKQMDGIDFSLVSGKVGTYGQNAATLWIADTGSTDKAAQFMTAIKARIDQGGTNLTPVGVFNFRSRSVYMLNGTNGQSDFYMQSGTSVFWVTIGPDQAEEAMKETLDFFPK